MPVDWLSPRIAHHGKDEVSGQGEPFFVAELGQADDHVGASLLGPGATGSEEPVPDGEVEVLMAVGFAYGHRVANPEHVRGDRQAPQPLVRLFGHGDVGVAD